MSRNLTIISSPSPAPITATATRRARAPSTRISATPINPSTGMRASASIVSWLNRFAPTRAASTSRTASTVATVRRRLNAVSLAAGAPSRCRPSHWTSCTNDPASAASDSAVSTTATGTGSTSTPTPAATTVRTIPCAGQTTVRTRLAGSVPRNHGNAQPAATNTYRSTPIASTQTPSRVATNALSARTRNASTSTANRVSNAVDGRANRALTNDDATATTATPTIALPGSGLGSVVSTTSAVNAPTTTALARTNRPAGPKEVTSNRRSPSMSTAQPITAKPTPASQTDGPSLTVTVSSTSTTTSASTAVTIARTGRPVTRPPSTSGPVPDLDTSRRVRRF